MSAWLLDGDNSLDRPTFQKLAHSWAQALPRKQYMILLCEQRRHFMLAFYAAQLAGQTVLLPSNRSPGALAEVSADYADSYCLRDHKDTAHNQDIAATQLPQQARQAASPPDIDDAHIAAIVFTSGSTGKAQPNTKTWGSLVTGAHLAEQRFGFNNSSGIVATVPPQHMYGLETTIMVPLAIGSQVHSGRPFYPEDVRLALQTCEGRRTLVTTPIHLRACVAATLDWPEVEQIICATAPLDQALLHAAEQQFKAPVREIYGCTEAGSLASRQSALGDEWTLYNSFSIREHHGEALIEAPHLSAPVELNDIIEILAHDRFRLQGRKTDLLNIAGKRASLSDLNIKLNAIPGVEDGIFIMPEQDQTHSMPRLAALVVAPTIDSKHIQATLATQIDPAFLPRPLYRVDKLPRNETGKLPRQALLDLLASKGKRT